MPKWCISKSFTISYAHRVFNQDLLDSGYEAKCRRLHGHDSEVIYKLYSSKLSNSMVLDYTLLKPDYFSKYNAVHAEHLDHKAIFSIHDPEIDIQDEVIKQFINNQGYYLDDSSLIVDFIPTAETLAQFLYNQFKIFINNLKSNHILYITDLEVCFNETKGSTCCYTE